jgi:HPt (histidine-containing phosphotransfer) domain-containing protein
MTAEPINRTQLASCSGGDLAFEQELLSLYVTHTREQLTVMQRAIAARDWENLQQIAHQLKGASSNLGIVSMQDLASHLEAAAKQEHLERLLPLWTKLETTFAGVVKQIEIWS